MASRPILSPYQVITNGDMSLASITSQPSIIQNLSKVAYSVSWAGSSPVGVLSVQVSNDYSQNAEGGTLNPGTWNTITLSTPANVSGNTGVGFIDIDSAAFAIRLVYTKTSGTGSLQAFITGKVA
jgi:hypothetical protein